VGDCRGKLIRVLCNKNIQYEINFDFIPQFTIEPIPTTPQDQNKLKVPTHQWQKRKDSSGFWSATREDVGISILVSSDEEEQDILNFIGANFRSPDEPAVMPLSIVDISSSNPNDHYKLEQAYSGRLYKEYPVQNFF